MQRFGLPKQSLLRKPGEFTQVYSKGTRVKGRGFALIVMANGLSWNRLGISVHRKVAGAVRRNRIKRIIRESFRLHRDVFPQCCDIIFAVRPYFRLDNPALVHREVALIAELHE